MSLADEIAAEVPHVVHRRTWWDELPAEAAAELLDVRQRFQAGKYGNAKRLQVARLVFDRCKSRGWKTCDATRLAQWLQKND